MSFSTKTSWFPTAACPAKGSGDPSSKWQKKIKIVTHVFWQVGAILPPEQRPLLLWLRNLPDPVVEQVFTSLLNLHLSILPELPSQTLTC